VQYLEPENLVALTVEAAAMARVPLAGTNWYRAIDPNLLQVLVAVLLLQEGVHPTSRTANGRAGQRSAPGTRVRCRSRLR
jgi:hypothetical protein